MAIQSKTIRRVLFAGGVTMLAAGAAWGEQPASIGVEGQGGGLFQRDVCKPFDDGLPDMPCIKTVEGKFGQAIVFRQYAIGAAPIRLSPHDTPQITFTAWIRRPEKGGASGNIISTGGAGGMPTLSIYGERLSAVAGKNAGPAIRARQDELGKIPREEWVFVAAVWDYTEQSLRLQQGDKSVALSNLNMSLEESDREVVAEPFTWTAPDGSAAREYVFVGGLDFRGMGGTATDIAIDDARIFTRALSEDELLAMAAGDTPVAGTALEEWLLTGGGGAAQIGETEKNAPAPDGGGEIVFPGSPVLNDDVQKTLEKEAAENAIPEPQYESEEAAIEAQKQREAAAKAEEEKQNKGDEAPDETPEGEWVPVGAAVKSDLAGHEGDYRDVLDLETKFLTSLSWMERNDVPCLATAGGVKAGQPSTVLSWNHCDGGTTSGVMGVELHSVGAIVGRLEVCTNPSSQRLKGLTIAGSRIAESGEFIYIPVESEDISANCRTRHPDVLCPAGTLATGVEVESQVDLTMKSVDRRSIVGMRLICRRAEKR